METAAPLAPTSRLSRQLACEVIPKRLRKAIRLMVHEGLDLKTAARQANMTSEQLFQSLDRPHVLAAMRREKQMLAESICAANPRRLQVIRDANPNTPAINAIRELEAMVRPDDVGRGSVAAAIGVTIQIVTARSDEGQSVLIEGKATSASDRAALDVESEEPEA